MYRAQQTVKKVRTARIDHRIHFLFYHVFVNIEHIDVITFKLCTHSSLFFHFRISRTRTHKWVDPWLERLLGQFLKGYFSRVQKSFLKTSMPEIALLSDIGDATCCSTDLMMSTDKNKGQHSVCYVLAIE